MHVGELGARMATHMRCGKACVLEGFWGEVEIAPHAPFERMPLGMPVYAEYALVPDRGALAAKKVAGVSDQGAALWQQQLYLASSAPDNYGRPACSRLVVLVSVGEPQATDPKYSRASLRCSPVSAMSFRQRGWAPGCLNDLLWSKVVLLQTSHMRRTIVLDKLFSRAPRSSITTLPP